MVLYWGFLRYTYSVCLITCKFCKWRFSTCNRSEELCVHWLPGRSNGFVSPSLFSLDNISLEGLFLKGITVTIEAYFVCIVSRNNVASNFQEFDCIAKSCSFGEGKGLWDPCLSHTAPPPLLSFAPVHNHCLTDILLFWNHLFYLKEFLYCVVPTNHGSHREYDGARCCVIDWEG